MTQVVIRNAPKFAKAITTGLEWTTASIKEFKIQKKRMSAQHAAWLALNGSNPATKEMVNYGQIEKAWLPKEGRSVSLAAWLAHTFKTGTVFAVERVDEGSDGGEPRYWFCAVIDGQVVTGTDTVDSWEAVLHLVQSSLEILDSDAVGYVGKDSEFLPTKNPEDPVSELSEVLTKAAFKKALLSRATESKAPAIAGIAVMSIALIGGGGYWWLAKQATEEAAVKRIAEAQRQQIKSAQVAYQGILSDIGEKPHAASMLNSIWFDALVDMPTLAAGWMLDSIECKDQQCDFTYQNTDISLPTEIRASIAPLCSELTIPIAATVAHCTRTLDSESIVSGDKSNPGFNNESKVVQAALTEKQVESLQADLMLVAKTGRGASYAINDPVALSFRGSRYLQGVKVFNQGEWSITFPVRYYQNILNTLNKYQGLSLSEASITWNAKVVELSGMYFTRGETEQ